MALCHITGKLYIPDGSDAANRRVEFQKLASDVLTDDYAGAVVPEPIYTKTDATGEVDVHLITGYYIGRALDRRGGKAYSFKATVPDQATANIADLINAADPILPMPSWLQEAWQARDEAEYWAGQTGDVIADAQAQADRAESEADRAAASNMFTIPHDFGAVGDGVADDTVAWDAFIAEPDRSKRVPPGSYLVRGIVLSFPNGRSLEPTTVYSPATGSSSNIVLGNAQFLVAGDRVVFRPQVNNAEGCTINGYPARPAYGSIMPAGYMVTTMDTEAVFLGTHFEVSRKIERGYDAATASRWVRYEDGTQEIWGLLTTTVAINIATGTGMFRSAILNIPLPLPFTAALVADVDSYIPVVTGRRTSAGHGIFATIESLTTTSFNIILYSTVEWSEGSGANRYAYWHAKGRWY